MKDRQERVRLLVLDRPAIDRSETISIGAAALVSKWPSHLISAMWCALVFISVTAALVLFMFFFIIRNERMYHESMFLPSYESRAVSLGDSLCTNMQYNGLNPNEDSNLLPLFNSAGHIFFFISEQLNNDTACALESTLRASQGKSVFLMDFSQNKKYIGYEKKLRSEFSNLIIIKMNLKSYLKGSMFDGIWHHKDRDMIAAEVLTLWQFGGTVITDQILTISNCWNQSSFTNVSSEVMFSPGQCSAFMFELMENVRRVRPSNGFEFQKIIEASLKAYCELDSTCGGVDRVFGICNVPSPGCNFVRMNKWEEIDPELSEVNQYCPVIYNYSKQLKNEIP